MAVDEAARHALFNRLEVVLGRDEAVCLMESLPPGGGAEVATKQDLLVLRNELVAHFEREIRRAITVQTLIQCATLVGVVAALRV